MSKYDSDLSMNATFSFSNGRKLIYSYQRLPLEDPTVPTHTICVKEIDAVDNDLKEISHYEMRYTAYYDNNPDVIFALNTRTPISFFCADSCFDSLYHIHRVDEFVNFLQSILSFSSVREGMSVSLLKSITEDLLSSYDAAIYAVLSKSENDQSVKDVQPGDTVEFIADPATEIVHVLCYDEIIADLLGPATKVLMPLLTKEPVTVEATIESVGKYVDAVTRKPVLELDCIYKVQQADETRTVYTLRDLFDYYWDQGYYIRDALYVYDDLIFDGRQVSAQFQGVQDHLAEVVRRNMFSIDDLESVALSVDDKNIKVDDPPWNFSGDFFFHYLFRDAAWPMTVKIAMAELSTQEEILAALKTIDEFSQVDDVSLEEIARLYADDQFQLAQGYHETQSWKKGEKWKIHIELI